MRRFAVDLRECEGRRSAECETLPRVMDEKLPEDFSPTLSLFRVTVDRFCVSFGPESCAPLLTRPSDQYHDVVRSEGAHNVEINIDNMTDDSENDLRSARV